jgi:hypothetical protein
MPDTNGWLVKNSKEMSECRLVRVPSPDQSRSNKKEDPNGTETCHLLSRGSLPEHDPALWLSGPGTVGWPGNPSTEETPPAIISCDFTSEVMSSAETGE